MSFITYKSIPNHNNKKEIDYFFKNNPEYLAKPFICQHKYDGSNFQVIFVKIQNQDSTEIDIQFASRNCLLEDGNNFNNYKEILKEQIHKNALENVKKFFVESKYERINLFGEIYGKVQNRIKYDSDNKNKILYFDVAFDDMYQNTKFFIDWSKKMELPIVEHFMIGTFEECLGLDLTKCKTQTGDQIEGVVIKPYDDETTEPFYVKLKSEGFEEVMAKKPEKAPKMENDKKTKFKALFDQYPELETFESYLNPNRAKSAFSKKSWVKKEQPQLANEIITDALKDFQIDFEDSKLSIDVAKKVYLTDIFKIINEEKFFN